MIVIFDSDSQYTSVAELSNAPINIVRECCTDCLDPNFINSDLPKVLHYLIVNMCLVLFVFYLEI